MLKISTLSRRLSVLALLAGCFGCSSSDQQSEPDAAADFSAVDAQVSDFMTSTKGVNGVTYVVVDADRGVVHKGSFGNLQSDQVELVTAAGMMVTTMVALSLVDEGLLALDTPVASYISWGSAHPEITLAQLLSNTSGLPGLSSAGFNYPPYACELQPDMSLNACARQIFTADLGKDLHEPGTAFFWGGGGWQVVGGIAEEVSGKPWKQLVEERVAKPCQLDSLSYAQPPFDSSLFNGDPASLPGQDNPSIQLGAMSNANDFATLLLAHLRSGKCNTTSVLSQTMIEQMRVDRGSAAGGDPYGLGWFIEKPAKADAAPSVFLTQGLFGTSAWVDTAHKYGAFIGLQSQAQDGVNLTALIRPMIEQALAKSPAK